MKTQSLLFSIFIGLSLLGWRFATQAITDIPTDVLVLKPGESVIDIPGASLNTTAICIVSLDQDGVTVTVRYESTIRQGRAYPKAWFQVFPTTQQGEPDRLGVASVYTIPSVKEPVQPDDVLTITFKLTDSRFNGFATDQVFRPVFRFDPFPGAPRGTYNYHCTKAGVQRPLATQIPTTVTPNSGITFTQPLNGRISLPFIANEVVISSEGVEQSPTPTAPATPTSTPTMFPVDPCQRVQHPDCQEPNDDFEQAKLISANNSITFGTLQSIEVNGRRDENDFYKVNFEQNRYYDIQLMPTASSPSDTTLDLYVYTANREIIWRGPQIAGINKQIIIAPTTNNTFYIVVSAFDAKHLSPYRLEVRLK